MSEIIWDDAAFERLMRQLGVRVGLAFRAHQKDSVTSGIRRAMTKAGMHDLRRYVARLLDDSAVLEELIVELTVGETYFFRLFDQFEFIRREILPEIRERVGHDHKIRMWSAGCASGEEPYSLAMLCQQEGLLSNVSILATDVSSRALSLAENATYRDWSLRGEGAESAKPYLKRDGEVHLLDQRIRDQVQFEFLNLALDVYPSHATATKQLDLILCRNVLIYFNPETIRAVARRFFDSLRDGGWLITAASDPPLDNYADFETVVNKVGVFYRKPIAAEVRSQRSKVRDLRSEAGSRQPEVMAGESIDRSEESTVRIPVSRPVHDPIAEAREALAAGEHARAVQLTHDQLANTAAHVVHLNALANLDTREALIRCREAVMQHPLSTELHYLHAVLSLEVNALDEAAEAVRRVIYLDRSLSIAHFTLATILQRQGKLDAARRHFRNVLNLCRTLPAGEILPLADGETVARLTQAATVQLATIEAATERNA